MTLLDRMIAFLEQRGCWYRHDVHPLSYTARETALADHVPPRSFAKTVVVHHADGFALAVLPADRIVNLSELREAFGSANLRLATETEVSSLFGDCDLGAMPPFGNGALYNIPVYADGLLMAEETIHFNAGTHRDVIRLKVEDWCELVRPNVLALSTGRTMGAGAGR
jgi:Ala-tRNA(Pro) deacylase